MSYTFEHPVADIDILSRAIILNLADWSKITLNFSEQFIRTKLSGSVNLLSQHCLQILYFKQEKIKCSLFSICNCWYE